MTEDVPATATAPDAPAGLTATVVSDGEVTLSWTVPSDGGSAITSYKIKQATASADLVATTPTTVAVGDITINDSSASYVVLGLADGTYYFQVAAMNSIDTGDYSTEVSASIIGGGGNTAMFSVSEVRDGLYLYPNPTFGEIRFMGLLPARRYTYKVYSLQGQEVLSGRLSSGKTDVSGLANGQYILVLEDEEGGKTLRRRLLIKALP